MRIDPPRIPRLHRREEKRIVALLSRLPPIAPPIAMSPFEGPEFPVAFRERGCCFVPMAIGAQGYYAFYDARTRAQLEASFLWVTRPVRVGGAWHLEVRETGGVRDESGFRIIWDGPRFHRGGGHPEKSRETSRHGFIAPRLLSPEGGARWHDAESAEGPTEGDLLFAGYATVSVGERSFPCMRVVTVLRNPDYSDPDASGSPEWNILDERYLTMDGRAALFRRFQTREGHEADKSMRCRDTLSEEDSDWPAGTARLRYNGIEFWHWFDALTDVSLPV